MNGTVLVTCGEQRSALAIVRSLGRAGWRVLVCASRVASMASSSRYAAGELHVPDPVARPGDFAAALAAHIERCEPQLVIPVTEGALLAALPLAGRHPTVTIPFPPLETFMAICDKTRVFDAARAEGIAVPREVQLSSGEHATRTVQDFMFPVVVKPARSVAGTGTGRSRHGVVHAEDWNALEGALAALPQTAFPVHVQQRIVGPGVGVFLLVWDGRQIATFQHRRLREKPPSGGVSVYRESVALDPELVERSRRLLERFDWEGVAMVEYKTDVATGVHHLMEVNARFWGSLELAIAAGVDFPLLLARAALGDAPAPVSSYAVGLRSRWIWGDVDHLIARLSRSNRSLSLPAGSPGRARVVWDFVRAFVEGRPEVFRLSDPGPALRETRDWFSALSRPRGGA